MRLRVVCGLEVTIATFCPTSRFTSVDFPAFGRPIIATNPALNPFFASASFFASAFFVPIPSLIFFAQLSAQPESPMRVSSLAIQTSSKTCHPEGRAVCGPKDLNLNFQQDAAIEILQLSSSDSLRMKPACPSSPLPFLTPYPRSFFLRRLQRAQASLAMSKPKPPC